MMNRFLFGLCTVLVFLFAPKVSSTKHKKIVFKTIDYPIQKLDTVKKDTLKKDSTIIDSISEEEGLYNYKLYKNSGIATYYANKFNGRKTASGERFSNDKLTAAHKKLPFGTKVRVTNLKNGKSIILKINDRGPHVRNREIDLSRKAFMFLNKNKRGGHMNVKIEIVHKK